MELNLGPLSYKRKVPDERQDWMWVHDRPIPAPRIYRLYGRTTPLGSDCKGYESRRFMTFWLRDISTSPVSHSSLMNVLESWPAEACVISPSFYHEEAARLSCGIRSTLCRDRQTLSANKMECLCISHLSVNIQMTASVRTCVCAHACGTQRTALAR